MAFNCKYSSMLIEFTHIVLLNFYIDNANIPMKGIENYNSFQLYPSLSLSVWRDSPWRAKAY